VKVERRRPPSSPTLHEEGLALRCSWRTRASRPIADGAQIGERQVERPAAPQKRALGRDVGAHRAD
jgi:hypothetical protein